MPILSIPCQFLNLELLGQTHLNFMRNMMWYFGQVLFVINQDINPPRLMKLEPKTTIFDHFCEMDDPRVERTKQHKLIDIITFVIYAVICGADTWIITIFELPSYSPQVRIQV